MKSAAGFLFSFLLPVSLLMPGYTFSQQHTVSGNLIIFHAGSMAVPLKEIASAFQKEYPAVKILMEAGGSVASARKITDLAKPCDMLISADYNIIDNLLIPQFADWNIRFSGNEMCIAFTEKSKYADGINASNWMNILRQPDVIFGRSDPNSDPCGYRTLMMLQLAESFYKKPGLYLQFKEKDKAYLRPKETDLLALLETGTVDFLFLYKSLAIQHKLKYLELPDAINLKNPRFAKEYSTAKVEINGKKPGEKTTIIGEPILYSFTIMRNAMNMPAAMAFAEFLLNKEKGQKILLKNGQSSIISAKTDHYEKIPARIRLFIKP